MSYMDMQPGYYEMLQPGTPWHPGGSGWTKSPYPAWGNNPNLVGPQFLAVNGLGAYYQAEYNTPITATSGLGAYYQAEYNTPITAASGLGQPPPVSAYRDGSLGQSGASTRGAVIALLGIAGLFIVGSLLAARLRSRRYARNRRRRNYRRNARWTTAYKDRLPDSAFLLVEPGGHKIKRDGKTYTVPKSLRKFPYKNVRGKVDLPHLRNVIARAPVADIPASKARKIQARARGILARAHEGKVATATKAA